MVQVSAFLLVTIFKLGLTLNRSYRFEIWEGKQLSSVQNTTVAQRLMECCFLCSNDPACVSVNFHPTNNVCQFSWDEPQQVGDSPGWTLASRAFAGTTPSDVGKTASQRSTFSDDTYSWVSNISANVAIDGKRDTNMGTGNGNTCTHTNNDYQPWWKVVSDAVVVIREVEILNRGDGVGWRLHDVVVTVDGNLCGTFPGPGTDSQVVTITCSTPMVGTQVKVQIDSPQPEIMSLCEVTFA